MAKDEIRKELDELRAQLEALQASRTTTVNAGPDADAAAVREPAAPAAVDEPGGESDVGSDLSLQFQELMEVLDRELRESNPTTLLAVFALGVLTGRLLPR